ncbi:MAG: hypothetical protein COB20_04135 [SAR86 cluster bacterium]|uniref:Uncharacterized protein n=1 Tax=SAR86 cluster bacterium TaxID=2030880 RepID=A0A2A4XBU7_9GAMM|nr:MAG: hypothetical protein COB20_04135 [SAR86 cluster bacterium]
MRAKLIIKLEPTRTSLLALALICSFLLASSPLFTPRSSAQVSDFQKNIDSTSEALIALDLKASDCLAAFESDENTQAVCDDFINALDGELMANYLEQCRTLKSWRDEYVDQAVTSDLDSDTANNEEMLRRLVSIEFTCGENTLRSRTQFVFSAFNRLRSGSATNGAGTATLSRQISNDRFNALENAERQRLQNALQNQRNRSLRESERQFNDLENELIRQQIRNSNLPN